MASRRMLRERALQALYAIEVGGREPSEAIGEVAGGDEAGADRSFVRELVLETLAHAAQVDDAIAPALREWTIDRLAIVDRTILRLAVCESLFPQPPRESTPRAVVINEAVELAKRYSTPEAARFINGVLSTVLADAPSPQT
ncbi:MAG TPA: transcription antitermination factor NusB [Candidatus Dormibacteraeota bacterium]|nr:transcription antitermination factor NusB [Candidatus Dormibacteraeota bacterium]